MLLRSIVLLAVILAVGSTSASAAKRIALLIGNQDYQINSLDLKNPHNDIATLGTALERVGFEVRIVKDAGLGRLHRAINRYAKALNRAGKDAIGFFYYSGHGALNEANRFNYIIPTDIDTVDSADLWDGSMRLRRIIDDLKDKARNATHFVVFDACRNELKLEQQGSRSLFQPKGFRPIRKTVRGMLVAYATAEGELATDVGEKAGPYAEALAKAIVRPGLEAVSMFREVQLAVYNKIGQEPWYEAGRLSRIYLAGRERPDEVRWTQIKDSNRTAEFLKFIKDFPKSQFAETARLRVSIIEERQRNQTAARAWEKLEKSKKISELSQYISLYPNHPYAELAKSRIQALKQDEKQRAQWKRWDSIKDSQDLDVLIRFIRDHPDSFLAKVAEARITSLKRSSDATRTRRDTEAAAAKAWDEVRGTNDADAYAAFIESFPSSPLADLAARELRRVERKARTVPRSPPVARAPPKPEPVKEPSSEEPQISQQQLTKSLQQELKRVGCDPGDIDGQWGPLGRNAIEQFNRYAGTTLDTLTPTIAAIDALQKMAKRVCPKAQPLQAPQQAKPVNRPNPLRYSYRIWSGGSVSHNEVVSRSTQYGTLTCKGGHNGWGIPRRCNWQ